MSKQIRFWPKNPGQTASKVEGLGSASRRPRRPGKKGGEVDERERGAPSAMVMWLAIVRTRPTLDRLGRWILDHLGLSLTDFKILENVLHAGPLTPSRLSDEISMTRGSVTSAVDRLAARGLVTREPNAADARSSLVKLTNAGAAVIEDAWTLHTKEVERVVGHTITPEERAVLVKLLGRLRRAVRKECRRVQAT